MSYYILPKKSDSLLLFKNKIFKSPNDQSNTDKAMTTSEGVDLNLQLFKTNQEIDEPFISNSIQYYIQSLEYEISTNKDCDINDLKKQMNPYGYLCETEFLNMNKVYSEQFFNYIEILKIANFFDIYTKYEITLYCLNEEIYDAFMFYNKSNNISYIREKTLSKEMIHTLCFDIDYEEFESYIFKFFSTLCKIILHQSYNGNCIIKIGDIIYKPIIDIIYIISCLYEKVYILKPNASNVFNNDRFLVCKSFRLENSERNNYYNYFNTLYLNMIIKKKELFYKNLSIISNEIPYYFLNKIEDSNIGIGNQRIEYLDLLVSLLTNKYNSEKVENINKNNIQKCILWCEKYKINYNKINEKHNIFINDMI
jgi:hypothetical protein